MGVRALAGVAKRRQALGLDAKTADRATDVLGAALAGGNRLTRAECLAALTGAGIEVTGQRGYHLLWYSSQQGVTVIAPHRLVHASDLGLRPAAPAGATSIEALTLEEVERMLIQRALQKHSGNVSDAAKTLGLSRSALYRRLERHGL